MIPRETSRATAAAAESSQQQFRELKARLERVKRSNQSWDPLTLSFTYIPPPSHHHFIALRCPLVFYTLLFCRYLSIYLGCATHFWNSILKLRCSWCIFSSIGTLCYLFLIESNISLFRVVNIQVGARSIFFYGFTQFFCRMFVKRVQVVKPCSTFYY